MDRHELALKTYEDLQKRKKQKEEQHRRDAESVGWNGYTQFVNRERKKYYGRRHSV